MRTHDEAPEAIDTAVVMDNVQVTAIKQGLTLRNRPVAASVVGRETIERRGVTAIKEMAFDDYYGFADEMERRDTRQGRLF